MSQKRKVAFTDEEESEYRRARAYAKLEDLGDGAPNEDVSYAKPVTKTKHTLDSDEEDNPDKHEKLRLDDIAGLQSLLMMRSCGSETRMPENVSPPQTTPQNHLRTARKTTDHCRTHHRTRVSRNTAPRRNT